MTAGERVYLAGTMGLVTLTSVRQPPITSIPTKCRPCCRSSGASPAQISRSRSMTASALGFSATSDVSGLGHAGYDRLPLGRLGRDHQRGGCRDGCPVNARLKASAQMIGVRAGFPTAS